VKINPIEVCVPWLPNKIVAITLWPFIFYRGNPSFSIVAHEHYHWYDIKRCWILPWYLVYLVLLPFYGSGPEHPLEEKAYKKQKEVELNEKGINNGGIK